LGASGTRPATMRMKPATKFIPWQYPTSANIQQRISRTVSSNMQALELRKLENQINQIFLFGSWMKPQTSDKALCMPSYPNNATRQHTR
jgi:hypothetical protein